MADLTLGLDLGSNSIGWALLDPAAGQIIATGVRVFPEGVDRDNSGGELSKNESRRIARSMRRQLARRSRRKRQLRAALVEAGLLPPNEPDQKTLDGVDPYQLRRRALDERLSPHEIGRILVHLNQRRGFQSNRRADRERKKENSDMLAEISALAKEIGDAGHRTLGEHLAHKVAKPGEIPLTRVRGRHTRRDMFLHEFEQIWSAQQAHHPALLTDAFKQRLHRIIFFQRDMYWPASAIGRCELEPRLPRCARADRRAQRFRLLQEVNNLRLLDTSTGEERKLTDDERNHLLEILSKSKELKFDAIRKKMSFLETVRFNLERGDRVKLQGLPTDAALAHKNLFGKTWWSMTDDDRNHVVGALIDGEESHVRSVCQKIGLQGDLVDRLVDTDVDDGYASYSLHAVKKLLPHLERGLPLSSRDGSPCALAEAGYILPWQHVPNQQQYLPDPPELTNPLVRSALHEVRKVVNAILRELVYKPGHKLARIHIELAREVKGTSDQRAKRSRDMRDRERDRDNAADRIREHGNKPTREAIERYRLWQEQREKCVYSGRSISLTQLLSGEVDIDHILPYPRSLDNSLTNRVVCFRPENAAKADRTPYEWLAESNPARYEQILQRADRLPYEKARRFRQKAIELDDFFARQFVDTTYITTQVYQYVRCLGADVVCTKGQHTADLRHQWGLNSVLRDDGLNLKNREDHRHHAVDAIVIALTDRPRLQQLAAWYRTKPDLSRRAKPGDSGPDARFPFPWPEFRHAVEQNVNAINVSHRPRRKIQGALHDETAYGLARENGEFVYRKPLGALTPVMVLKIRDQTVRNLVIERLREFGIEPKRGGGKISTDVWRKPLLMPSGVPICRVRLTTPSESIRPIRGGKVFVQPGNTHHLCLFEIKRPDGRTVREPIFVSMLQAVDRLKARQPIIQRTHPKSPTAKFLMSISMNEMLLLNHQGKETLVRFETAASTSHQMWFRCHAAGGKSSEQLGVISKTPGTLDARKVTVDPIGRIRWAND